MSSLCPKVDVLCITSSYMRNQQPLADTQTDHMVITISVALWHDCARRRLIIFVLKVCFLPCKSSAGLFSRSTLLSVEEARKLGLFFVCIFLQRSRTISL